MGSSSDDDLSPLPSPLSLPHCIRERSERMGGCQEQVDEGVLYASSLEGNNNQVLYHHTSSDNDVDKDTKGNASPDILVQRTLYTSSLPDALGALRSPSINRMELTAHSFHDPVPSAPPAVHTPPSTPQNLSPRRDTSQRNVCQQDPQPLCIEVEEETLMRLDEYRTEVSSKVLIHSPIPITPDPRRPNGKLRRLDHSSPTRPPNTSSAPPVATATDNAVNMNHTQGDDIHYWPTPHTQSQHGQSDPNTSSPRLLELKPLHEAARGHNYDSLSPRVFHRSYSHRTESFYRLLSDNDGYEGDDDSNRGDLTRTLAREPPQPYSATAPTNRG